MALDPQPDTSHLTEHKYLQGRPSTANPNPRGKHHRNPLPWKGRKLFSAWDWQDDAAEYRRQLFAAQGSSVNPGNIKNQRPNKPHLLNFIQCQEQRNATAGWGHCPCCADYRRGQLLKSRRTAWRAARDEGIAMAREYEIGLPGDDRWKQDERPRRAPWFISRQTADDEQDWSAFAEEADVSLNSIAREEPVYTIRSRALRKPRRRRTAAAAAVPIRTCHDAVPGVRVDEVSFFPGAQLYDEDWIELNGDDGFDWELASAASTVDDWEALDYE